MTAAVHRLVRRWGIDQDIAEQLLAGGGCFWTARWYDGPDKDRVVEALILGPAGEARASISPSGRIEVIRYLDGRNVEAESERFLRGLGLLVPNAFDWCAHRESD